ncbi:hypothetical protein Y032_0132g1677 [Ancylostoma ceylanicum]|uniref:Uncharacterized protein n=1 Tax=Ancylostoma ceylanicum TaxID=53326 RepID=A0A016T6F6_9BILA|nr:hypothetical protein Y032_0132g1677 [Ancylostoma ceylanicum]
MCSNEQELVGKQVFHGIMDSSTQTPDRSINGLIVFLTLFLFLTVLTSGLLVCLSKIWCGQRKSSGQAVPPEQRQSVAGGCSLQDSDSDEEAQPINRPPMVRRFSQRIINFVQRPFQEDARRPTIEESPEPPVLTAHTIHGATENSTLGHSGSNTNELPVNDPTCVIYL